MHTGDCASLKDGAKTSSLGTF